MDGQRFDGMTKRLAMRASRRSVLGGLLAAGAGALVARAAGAEGAGIPPADPSVTGCAMACGVEFPREGQAAKRRGCTVACTAAAAGNATCAAACRAEFPAAEQRGARRGCAAACVRASEGAE